eukprot:CAMPEP_0204843394 /NCGR_PEP_ID=MMETSP1346-20131115/47953_1 /ASSEMBLY_ACC=CAM_ASM_000771 /TAXON_ID=215587 /ORGANISM="Aplanochytrium stocchinoi, Strain GSBS06" /LENGTH=689 /DNA_ID=CAMNT_0051982529 /DNA_START=101 /DNA_END=2170 /DNA_ORIENTATION=-
MKDSAQRLYRDVFDERDKQLLIEPQLGLAEWTGRFLPAKVRVEVTIQKKKRQMTGKKSYIYVVKTTDPNLPLPQESIRKDTDFLTLYNQLQKRFPNAYVPPCTGPFRNAAMMEIFLQAVSNNPFFRNDFSYEDFVDGRGVKSFKHTLSKSGRSEGTLRWAQAINEEPTANSDYEYIAGVVEQFGILHQNAKKVLDCMILQADALKRMEKATEKLEGVLEATGQIPGKALIPMQVIGDYDEAAIQTRKHKMAIKGAYGYNAFSRKVVDRLQYDVSVIVQWQKTIKRILANKKAYEKVKAALKKAEPGTKTDALEAKKATLKVDLKNELQGILGYDLSSFRENRLEEARELYNELARFHILGATEVLKVWKSTGATIDNNNAEEEFTRNLNYPGSVDGRSVRTGGSSFNIMDREGRSSSLLLISPRGSVGSAHLPPPGLHAKADDWDLESFRENRLEEARELYNELARFHILGATEVLKVWKSTGATIDNNNAEEEFTRNLNYPGSVDGRSVRTGGSSFNIMDREGRSSSLLLISPRGSVGSAHLPPPGLHAKADDWDLEKKTDKTPPAPTGAQMRKPAPPKLSLPPKAIVSPPKEEAPVVVETKSFNNEANSMPKRPPMPGGANFLAAIQNGATLNKVADSEKSENIGGTRKPSINHLPAGAERSNSILAELAPKLQKIRAKIDHEDLDY